jgi:hypothetical protein
MSIHFLSIKLPVPVPSAAMNHNLDSQRLATVIRELQRFGPDLGSSRNQLDQQTTLARSIIRFLDETLLLQRAAPLSDQVFIVSRLQDLAYHEPDSGAIADIANWCVIQWLRLLQQHAEDVGVMQGQSFITPWSIDRSLTPAQALDKLGSCVRRRRWRGFTLKRESRLMVRAMAMALPTDSLTRQQTSLLQLPKQIAEGILVITWKRVVH